MRVSSANSGLTTPFGRLNSGKGGGRGENRGDILEGKAKIVDLVLSGLDSQLFVIDAAWVVSEAAKQFHIWLISACGKWRE